MCQLHQMEWGIVGGGGSEDDEQGGYPGYYGSPGNGGGWTTVMKVMAVNKAKHCPRQTRRT